LRIWVTNSALRASFPAIKRVTKGGIAHLGHQFGTLCLNPAIKKVIQDGIAEHLWQIDGLQIQHFAYASSGNQEMAKQLCEGVPAPEQYHVTGVVRRSIDSLNFAQHYNPYFLHKFQDAISRHPGIRFMRS
jgi:hypothetical protein